MGPKTGFPSAGRFSLPKTRKITAGSLGETLNRWDQFGSDFDSSSVFRGVCVVLEAPSTNTRSSVRIAEATYSINFGQLFQVMQNNLCMLRWVNEYDFPIGLGNAVRVDDALHVKHWTEMTRETYVTGLDIAKVNNGHFGIRTVVTCPGCSSTRETLYLVRNNWKCFDCHKMRYASQCLTSAERWALQRERLEIETKRERGFGEHKKAYARRRADAIRRLAEANGPDIGVRRRPMPRIINTEYSAVPAGPWLTK